MRARPLGAQRPPGPLIEASLPSASDAVSRGGLRVFYPASYDDAFVVELGNQRVVLRPIGARFAQGTASAGRLSYTSPYDSVDVIHLPSTARSEELLVLYDARAPRIFDYEIVEMRGVAGLTVQDGAIRFVPDPVSQMPSSFTATPASIQIDRPSVIAADGRHLDSAAQWTIVEEHEQPRRIRLTIHTDGLAWPLIVDPSFSAAGTMNSARYAGTATLLPNGKVLLAGGESASGYLNTAELYDPASGTFTATSSLMTSSRYLATATLLANGKVLIAGGYGGSGYVSTAELYDPASGTFAATGSMSAARGHQTATLLQNGKVLIAGGQNGSGFVSTAELYDPAGGTFTFTSGSMTSARVVHTATLLPSGKVLLAGGNDGSGFVKTAELYDPASGTFTATGSTMTSVRALHTATLLPNGKVLIAGGADGSSFWSSAELYDPVGGTFTLTSLPMNSARFNATATLLPNGKVLLAGGRDGSAYFNTAELYDPAGGTFTAAGSTMTSLRASHTATLLPNGKVLLAGGSDGPDYLDGADLYDPASGTFAATSGSLTSTRAYHTATLLPNGKVLIAGGDDGSPFAAGYQQTAELFDPGSASFTATSAPMTSVRAYHTATLLPNGKVLIAGGTDGGSALSTAELYDPAGGTFTATSSPMISARSRATATLLPSGMVLIAGGAGGAAELYDPAGGTFTATSGTMTATRSWHTATLLLSGKVLLAGGFNALGPLNTAELYDPAIGTFTATSGPITAARQNHTATLLPNGLVLITGGLSVSSTYLNTAELYDPGSDTFTATSVPMSAARYFHTATLLANGKVLIAGGFNGLSTSTADLFDPASRTFTATSAPMTSARHAQTATLLPNGKVLIAAGVNGWTYLKTAELFDDGLGYSASRQPVVSSLIDPLCQPASLTLAGSLFTSDSEGSSGSTNSSPGNAPLLRLQRVDNEQLQFAFTQSFSAVSVLSSTLSNLFSGRYRAAIVSNAVPSNQQIIEVETTPLLGTYGTASVNLYGSTAVAASSLPSGYNGALYPQTVTASSGFSGTLRVNGTTGAVMVTNAGPVGDYTITVSSSTSCGSVATTFTLKVLGQPYSVTATGGTPQSAEVNTPFATQLQALVVDSAGHPLANVTVNFRAPSYGARATFPGGGTALTNSSGIASITATANGNLGSYNATGFEPGASTDATFALTNAPATPINVVATAATPGAVVITWTGTFGATYEVQRLEPGGISSTVGSSTSGPLGDFAVSANTAYLYKVRAILPSASPYSAPDLATTVIFTDPTLVAGMVVKAAHFTELRTAVDAVRALAGMSAGTYTDAVLSPGATLIKSIHLTELRTALDASRSALLLLAVSYTRPGIVPGTTTISASDINDLRNGVR